MWEKCGIFPKYNVFNLLAKSKIKTKNKSETVLLLTKKICLMNYL